jgi:transcriptional regulator with XRE-family HTH domain
MNTSNKNQLGNSIRSLRRGRKLSQINLSEVLQVKQSTVSRWEAGIDQPSLEKMATLVKLFDCSFDELICGKNLNDPQEVILLNTYRTLSSIKKQKLHKFIEEIL